jgi:Eco29kI-like restriction endonuclease
MVATRHFTFDLTGALAEQLEAMLPNLTPEPLATGRIQGVSTLPGIYQLYLSGELVYVGKADRNLQDRLSDHYRKIIGRENIDINDMTFTGLYLEGTWIPVGPEQILINRWEKTRGAKPPWNVNGFGIKDPGRERDTTTYRATHFDSLYPADLNYVIGGVIRGTCRVNELLPIVKRELPYVFRYEDQWARHPDYLESRATITASNPTAADVFDALVAALPAGWQITALPGYVIMYKNVRSYPSARRTFRS